MAGKLNLDPQTIVDKEFDIDFKGYNPDQVDHMLDQIILDYQTYSDMINELNAKIKELDCTNASLRAKVIEYEGKLRMKPEEEPVFGSNVDIIKRLSRLESQVFDNQKKD
ncbi:MAG: DivIVA domain-containing protein [Erysipelotrichaceae bacterium]|jgi:DivIVA domain-containing protein|nr:DivIVA domain-containing protein [Erysipelotrichaceae bacterium]